MSSVDASAPSENVFLGSALFEEIDTVNCLWDEQVCTGENQVVVMDPVREDSEVTQAPSTIEEKQQAVRNLISSIAKEDIAMEQDDDVADPDYKPKKLTTSGRKRRRTATPAQDGVRVKQSRISDKVLKTADGFKKPEKLYSHTKPFADPKLEKARQNAINAKINRDRKKKEKAALTVEMETLRRRNEELERERSEAEIRAAKAEEELTRMRRLMQLSGITAEVKCNEQHHSTKDRDDCHVCGLEQNEVAATAQPAALLAPDCMLMAAAAANDHISEAYVDHEASDDNLVLSAAVAEDQAQLLQDLMADF